MLCKISKNNKNCGSGTSNKVKSKLTCILDSCESTRLRVGESLPTHCGDHIAGRRDNSLQRYNLVHKFIPMPQAMKIHAAKQQWTRNGKIGVNFGVEPDKRSKKEVIDEVRTKGAKVHFASLMDICHLKNAELETKAPKIPRSSCAPRWYCERWFGSYAVFTEQGSSASQMTAAKVTDIISRLLGFDGQAADAVSAHTKEKWKMHQNYWKCQNRNVQTLGFVYHDTNGQNHGPTRKIQSFLLAKSVRSSFGRTVMGKAIWQNLIAARLGEGFQLGMLIRTPWKGVILSCVCGWHQIFWKETKHWSDVESTQWRSWFGRTNIFLGSCIFGLHSKTMRNKQRYCGQSQSHVRIENFCGWIREITIPSKFSYFFMVLWHGWSCKEVCGTILWVGKQDDSTTLQSIYSMHRWPPFQRRRIEICRRMVLSMLSYCSEMLIFGKNWTTWYSMVSEQTCTIHYKMDQSLWQTIESFDILHPWHMWIQRILFLWVILQNNADWDCFKTQILREILRTQNLLLEEHYAFLEVIHLFQQVIYVKSSLVTLDWDWTGFALSNYGI